MKSKSSTSAAESSWRTRKTWTSISKSSGRTSTLCPCSPRLPVHDQTLPAGLIWTTPQTLSSSRPPIDKPTCLRRSWPVSVPSRSIPWKSERRPCSYLSRRKRPSKRLSTRSSTSTKVASQKTCCKRRSNSTLRRRSKEGSRTLSTTSKKAVIWRALAPFSHMKRQAAQAERRRAFSLHLAYTRGQPGARLPRPSA